MSELISFIECRFIIIINALPIYQTLFITYLIIPIIIVTRYRYSNPQVKSILLSFALLAIWIIQVVIWKVFHDMYYRIWWNMEYFLSYIYFKPKHFSIELPSLSGPKVNSGIYNLPDFKRVIVSSIEKVILPFLLT